MKWKNERSLQAASRKGERLSPVPFPLFMMRNLLTIFQKTRTCLESPPLLSHEDLHLIMIYSKWVSWSLCRQGGLPSDTRPVFALLFFSQFCRLCSSSAQDVTCSQFFLLCFVFCEWQFCESQIDNKRSESKRKDAITRRQWKMKRGSNWCVVW